MFVMPRNWPHWLGQLSEVAEGTEAWLNAIANSADSAVQGLLRRHGLSEPDLRTERLAEIGAALADGRLSGEALAGWREDVLIAFAAVEGISDFRRKEPLAQAFCQSNSLEIGTLEAMKGRICDALWRGDLPLRSWLDFLDNQRVETDRHLFLYRLPLKQSPGLRPLSKVRDLPSECVWKADTPLLVDIQHNRANGQLHLRWVGWRPWDRAARDGPLGRRCVTFLTLDLQRGDMLLQLQSQYAVE